MEHSKRSVSVTLFIDRAAMAAWVICMFLIPLLGRLYDKYSGREPIFVWFVVCTYAAMAPGGAILFSLNLLLGNLRREKVFEHENVRYLRVISYCCFVIAAICAVISFVRPLGFALVASFLFIGLLLRVLKNVFEQAVYLREENDLTV